MNFKDLEIFTSLSRNSNMSEVARTFYISQSSVSYSISKIENEIGICLFHRNGKLLKLTPEGALFAVEAQKLLDSYHGLSSQFLTYSYAKPLRVGWANSDAMFTCNELLRDFHQNYPDVNLFFSSGPPGKLMEMYRNGRLDVLITSREHSKPDLGTGEYLGAYRMVFTCRPDSLFVEKEALDSHYVTKDALLVPELPILMKQPDDLNDWLGLLISQYVADSPPCRISGIYSSFRLALEGAEMGLGVALVGDLVAAQNTQLSWFEIPGFHFEDEKILFFRESEKNRPYLSAFCTYVRQFFREYTAMTEQIHRQG